MFNFDQMISDVDKGLIKDFGVDVEIDSVADGVYETRGIFDAPGILSEIATGGWISDIEAELFIMEAGNESLTTRDKIKIGKQWFSIYKPPERDSSGLLKLVLTRLKNERTPRPAIRY